LRRPGTGELDCTVVLRQGLLESSELREESAAVRPSLRIVRIELQGLSNLHERVLRPADTRQRRTVAAPVDTRGRVEVECTRGRIEGLLPALEVKQHYSASMPGGRVLRLKVRGALVDGEGFFESFLRREAFSTLDPIVTR